MKTVIKQRPSKVLRLFADKNGGVANTRVLLATAMREGKIRVKAAQRWESSERSLLKIWKNPPLISAEEAKAHRITCKRGLWWRSVRWLDDVSDWDFSRGRMIVTVQEDPLRRICLKDVRFNSTDVKRLLDDDAWNGKINDKSGYNKERWRTFWHEIVALASGSREAVKNSGLAAYTSDAALMIAIKDHLESENDRMRGIELDDDALVSALTARTAFNLSEDAIKSEIKHLRQAFKLKSWGKNSDSGREGA